MREINGPVNVPPRGSPEQRLRQVAVELEGVFYAQLFQAMRQGVAGSGDSEESSAEQLFTGMFDQEMAVRAAAQGDRGLAEAMYRQLSQQLQGGDPPDQSSAGGVERDSSS